MIKSIKDKISLNKIIVVWGIMLLVYRIISGQSEINDYFIISVILLIVFGVILLVISIFNIFKKYYIPFLIFILFFISVVSIPFELITGWLNFQFNEKDRLKYLSKLNGIEYNKLLQSEKYPEYGIWIEASNPRVKIFKNDSLKLLFFWQSHRWNGEQYCGTLYISNELLINDRRIFTFLGREFKYTKLDYNWYWVDCYIEYVTGP